MGRVRRGHHTTPVRNRKATFSVSVSSEPR